MAAYYNEIDPFAAAWLTELIREGHVADGVVDTRSITDVDPADLVGFTQHHFFAGIGGWSLALRLAGWPDDHPVWTGSCPCQPFSAAGKRQGIEDDRHLWPAFFRLIAERRPAIVFGEQVASADGLKWLDLVCADLEGAGYACGAADLCAAGVGAPHIRQRLWFVAERLEHTQGDGREERGPKSSRGSALGGCGAGGLGDPYHPGLEGQRSGHPSESGRLGAVRSTAEAGEPSGLAHADGGDTSAEGLQRSGEQRQQPEDCGARGGSTGRARPDAGSELGRPGPTNGVWRDADWLYCRDGKWRPVEPGTFPLAHGIPARVGRLRGYGNAIIPQVAAAFIDAYLG